MPRVLKFREMLTESGFRALGLQLGSVLCHRSNTQHLLTPCNSSGLSYCSPPLSTSCLSCKIPSCCRRASPESCVLCEEPGKSPSHFWSKMKHLNQSYSATVKPIHLETAVAILPYTDTSFIY